MTFSSVTSCLLRLLIPSIPIWSICVSFWPPVSSSRSSSLSWEYCDYAFKHVPPVPSAFLELCILWLFSSTLWSFSTPLGRVHLLDNLVADGNRKVMHRFLGLWVLPRIKSAHRENPVSITPGFILPVSSWLQLIETSAALLIASNLHQGTVPWNLKYKQHMVQNSARSDTLQWCVRNLCQTVETCWSMFTSDLCMYVCKSCKDLLHNWLHTHSQSCT